MKNPFLKSLRRSLIAALLAGGLLWYFLPPTLPLYPRLVKEDVEVNQMRISPNGKILLSYSDGFEPGCRLWRLPDFHPLASPPSETRQPPYDEDFPVGTPVFSPDSKSLVLCSRRPLDKKCRLEVWNIADGKFALRKEKVFDVLADIDPIIGCSYSQSGSLLISIYSEGKNRGLTVWNVKTDEEKKFSQIWFHGQFAVRRQAESLIVYDLETNRELTRIAAPPECNWRAITPEAKVMVGLQQGFEKPVVADRTRDRYRYLPWSGYPDALADDGRFLTMNVYNPNRGFPLNFLADWFEFPSKGTETKLIHLADDRDVAQFYNVRATAFSPDGKTLAIAREDNTIEFWYLELRPPWWKILPGAGVIFVGGLAVSWWFERRRRKKANLPASAIQASITIVNNSSNL